MTTSNARSCTRFSGFFDTPSDRERLLCVQRPAGPMPLPAAMPWAQACELARLERKESLPGKNAEACAGAGERLAVRYRRLRGLALGGRFSLGPSGSCHVGDLLTATRALLVRVREGIAPPGPGSSACAAPVRRPYWKALHAGGQAHPQV